MAKPPPSEWGKVNAGQPYGAMATDFGCALFGVDPPWGKYELRLIFYLFLNSYGVAWRHRPGGEWPDPRPVEINFSALAKRWKCDKQRLYEARDSLMAKRFMIESPEGYWISKEADEWIDPKTGRLLLCPAMLTEAASHRRRKTDAPVTRETVDTSSEESRSSVTITEDTQDASICVGHAGALLKVTAQRDFSDPPPHPPSKSQREINSPLPPKGGKKRHIHMNSTERQEARFAAAYAEPQEDANGKV